MRTTEKKTKQVSSRVLLTPMPEDGTDQFTFLRPMGGLNPLQVENLLQFNDFVNHVHLHHALNKLLSSFIVSGDSDILPEEMIAIETTIAFLVNCWEAEKGTFTPLHPSFDV